MSDHLFTLPGGEWSVWRDFCTRAAGFPATLALGLALPAAAAAADRLLDAEEAAAKEQGLLMDTLRALRMTASADEAARLVKAGRVAASKKVPQATGTVADEAIGRYRDASSMASVAAAAFRQTFAVERVALAARVREIAQDSSLREAMTWQNRSAVEHAILPLLRAERNGTRSSDRQKEALVASYLHRYTTKNDTIGFFGPVAWSRILADGERVEVAVHPQLLARRRTYFEQWGVDALTQVLAKDVAVRAWLPPRRFGFVRLESGAARSPLTGRKDLTALEEGVLRACDSVTLAREIPTLLLPRFPQADRAAIFAVLDELVAAQLIAWDLGFRTTWEPEQEARRRLGSIGDDELREACLSQLTELDLARQRVEDAAGDADQLATALVHLEGTFTRLTALDARRNAGSMYASRSLVFEDCQRGLDLTLGASVLDEIGPALALVLTSARHLTYEVGKAYSAAFHELFATLARENGSGVARFSEFWFRAERLFHGTASRPVDDVAAEVEAKWERILGPAGSARRAQYAVTELAEEVAKAFPAPHAGWSSARHHSPDLMIAASSVEAFRRGEYLAVLGEVHVASNSLDFACLVAQHPAPETLARAVASDLPGPRVFPVTPKNGIRMGNVRGARALFTPNDYEIERGLEGSSLPRERALPLAELDVVLEGETLVVASHDGRFRLDLMEVVGSALGDVVMNALAFQSKKSRAPRITIDRLVVQRETWRFAPADMAFCAESTEEARFVSARRWARAHGMPRFVFLTSSLEVKPVFVDFDSPIAVSTMAKLARQARDHVTGDARLKVTEMLPAFGDTWLPDADGHCYTAELRMVAFDQRRREPTGTQGEPR